MNDISNIKHELDEITKVIVKTLPVETIYLFGSYAYGTPNKDSDYDIYIVFKDEMNIRIIEAINTINFALASVKTKSIDFIGLKKERFLYKKNQPTIERKIAREGIRIYG